MVLMVVLAFALQTFFAHPDWTEVGHGIAVPSFEGTDSIILAAGILGATVMPHAIYLHSALTNKRVVGRTEKEKKQIFRFEFIDIVLAMIIAGAINMSMLVIAAALFFDRDMRIDDLTVMFNELGSTLGPFTAILFGFGLLIAGLSSSSVGTMSGDVVMQGFIRKSINLYLRRAITMIPPLAIILSGVNATKALVTSQVVLSFGIAFALVPLIMFTSNREIMGGLKNHRMTTAAAWVISFIVILLNAYLIVDTFL